MKGSALLKDRTYLVQGITGKQGSYHTRQMLDYGTRIVGGVTPGKGGQTVHGIPVFNDVQRAMARTGATASVAFVPAANLKDAVQEGLEAGLEAMVLITERTPIHDTMGFLAMARRRGTAILGPNCPGLCIVGESKVGIMPNHIFKKGGLAIISRSGTLTYEVVQALSSAGLGQDVVLGLGGDRLLGTDMREAVEIVLEGTVRGGNDRGDRRADGGGGFPTDQRARGGEHLCLCGRCFSPSSQAHGPRRGDRLPGERRSL